MSMYAEPTQAQNISAIRAAFKYYKQKNILPDLSKVVDFHQNTQLFRHVKLNASVTCNNLYPINEWYCCEVIDRPGLFCMHNVLTDQYARHLSKECANIYPYPPNVTNLTSLPQTSVLHQYNGCNKLLDKLRWSTLGYHYDWTEKVYREKQRTPFPPTLHAVCSTIAAALNFTKFDAQAAIVNYYKSGDTLYCHQDVSEWEREHPLISISLGGPPAIYLSGDVTIDNDAPPLALWLRHADILIMSGEQRQVYHAVPLTMHHTSFSTNFDAAAEELDHKTIEYLNDHRLNLSIRQVHSNEHT